MRVITLGALLLSIAAPGYAADCSVITAATMAEIRAGEAEWDERAESLVRRAAGAACVKTMTEIEGAESAVPGVGEANAEVAADETANQSSSDDDDDHSGDDDSDAGWKFLGFDVNPVQGSPSQKSYQRNR
jgi:hypothetical protein